MKKLYLIFTLTVIVMVVLLTFSFIFFEKEKHMSYFFIVEENGKITGHVKVDAYKTEDKRIYKSTTFRPFEIAKKIAHEKIVFTRKDFMFMNSILENKGFGAKLEGFYVKSDGKDIGFLAKIGPKFSTVSEIHIRHDASPFEESAILTYMPFIDRYDFNLGGAQDFEAIYYSGSILPPGVGSITFKSIRDEYITVDERKTKAEHVVVQADALPDIRLWISKKDWKIARLEIREKGILIKRVSKLPPKMHPKIHSLESDDYESQDVFVSSEDVALSGTLDVPKKDGKLAAVLLIAGEGQYDRENAGLYTSISHKLADSGYIVLRLDNRGIGKSQGNNMSVSSSERIRDINNSIGFLSRHEKVDKSKIFIVAHSESCNYLSDLDFLKQPVKGLIALSIIKPSPVVDFGSERIKLIVERMAKVDQKYAVTLDLSQQETLRLVKEAKSDYAFKLGRRVFLKEMRELAELNALLGIKALNVPLIAIHGRKDILSSGALIKSIEGVLERKGADEYSFVPFRDLGHFLGKPSTDGTVINHYVADPEVLETISDWIDTQCKPTEHILPEKNLKNTIKTPKNRRPRVDKRKTL